MSYGFGVSVKTRDCFGYISKINVRVGDRLRIKVSATLLLLLFSSYFSFLSLFFFFTLFTLLLRLVFVLRLGLEVSLGLWFRVLGEP